MKIWIGLLMLASVGAWGQDPGAMQQIPCHKGQAQSIFGGCIADTAPKPLKCGKYERIEHKMAEMTCLYPEGHPERCPAPRYIDSCAPIMHEVTEKEWQELMERVKNLEEPHFYDRETRNLSYEQLGYLYHSVCGDYPSHSHTAELLGHGPALTCETIGNEYNKRRFSGAGKE